MAEKIVVFDFDGTLTVCDTLPYLLKGIGHYRGGYYRRLALSVPWLVAYKLRLIPAGKSKQRVTSMFVKGMTLDDFDECCRKLVDEYKPKLLRPAVLEELQRRLSDGDEVHVCTANYSRWVELFLHPVKVPILATGLEVRDGVLTGRFSTPNCNGEEKWTRLKPVVEEKGLPLVVYGDSKGDEAMMSHAQEKNWVK